MKKRKIIPRVLSAPHLPTVGRERDRDGEKWGEEVQRGWEGEKEKLRKRPRGSDLRNRDRQVSRVTQSNPRAPPRPIFRGGRGKKGNY